MKVAVSITQMDEPFGEVYWASCLRENFMSSSYGEGLETGRALAQTPRQSFTRQETLRYVKQSYELEDVRVLNYRSLQNIMPLVCAAAYFAAVLLDPESKLKVIAGYVLKAAKRLFGIPDFHYYSIADGLTSIFMRHPGRIVRPLPQSTAQGSLFISSA